MSQRKSRPRKKSGKSLQNNKGQPPNRLPLAVTTVNAFLDLGATSDNVGLLFDRYVHFVGPGWSIETYKVPGRKPGRMETKNAKEWNLQQIVETQTRLKEHWQQGIFAAAIGRWQAVIKSAESFQLTPAWRFVVGLGDKTALEVGFTFHRIYGFPIIPGSTLKGLTRTAALSEIADLLEIPRLGLAEAKKRAKAKKEKRCQHEECDMPLVKLDNLLGAYDEKTEKEALASLRQEKGLEEFTLKAEHRTSISQFRRIFGTQQAAGETVFFDAMPAEAPTLEIDVMNVHYPDYYSGDVFPTDSQNPNPIPFLTVGKTPFWFAVGWRNEVDQEGLKQARDWLETGLREFGIGAKTAAGYGYFEVE